MPSSRLEYTPEELVLSTFIIWYTSCGPTSSIGVRYFSRLIFNSSFRLSLGWQPRAENTLTKIKILNPSVSDRNICVGAKLAHFQNHGPTFWHYQRHYTTSQSRAISSQTPKCANLAHREPTGWIWVVRLSFSKSLTWEWATLAHDPIQEWSGYYIESTSAEHENRRRLNPH